MKRFIGFITGAIALILLFQFVSLQVVKPLAAGTVAEAESVPYMEYQIYNNTIVVDSEPLPVLPGGMGDYAALFDKYNLCDLVTNGEIDEVWIWAGNGDGITLGNLLEWTTTGPGWSGLTPDCGKVVTTMVYNYTLETSFGLHSYGHRIEGLMRHHQPCDFSTANWPWDAVADTSGDFANCGTLLSDTYGFVARPFPGNSHVAGCGDVHFPPNISQEDNQEYTYNELATADSICPDWSMDGTAAVTELNCQIWGCTEYGYQIWWMQNLPGLNNTNRTRLGEYQPNWWDYLFDGSYVPTPTPTFTPTATATLTPTPTVTPTLTPTPDSDELNFLPFVISPPQNGTGLTNVSLATQPEIERLAKSPLEQNLIIESLTATAAEAVVKPVVFVIDLTAYAVNGAPLDDVAVLNANLITGLKEATIYHGYLLNPYLQASFLGQDGASFAGIGCAAGTASDNAHIQLSGLKSDVQPVSYRLDDVAGGGVWASPCDPVSNWLLYVESTTPDTAEIYFKPFRDAPDGTIYTITVTYDDGSVQSTSVVGSQIAP